MDLTSILLLVAGFSLIILLHEAGHFLAAKYVGIRVEQFALGFGQALFSWRRGLGLRIGSTEKEYAQIQKGEKSAPGGRSPDQLGETEYRFNWIPLGGYVKMLGQDDTKPGLVVDDPRSYTSKSVGARMLVISAGVIMNIIFAAIAFMVVFLMGMDVQAPVVGAVTPLSPAQMAVNEKGEPSPIQVGDRILRINGRIQHDFGKIQLSTALAAADEALRVEVQRVDGSVEQLRITPKPSGIGGLRLLQVGLAPSQRLEGPKLTSKRLEDEYAQIAPDVKQVMPGETIVAIEGETVNPEEYYKLDAAAQRAEGKPVTVSVDGPSGSREVQIQTQLLPLFGHETMQFAGMVPRAKVVGLTKPSAVEGKIEPDDVIVEIAVNGDIRPDPSEKEVRRLTAKTAEQNQTLRLKVLRKGQVLAFDDLDPNIRLENGQGLGLALTFDTGTPVVADTLEGSAAAAIPPGSRIMSVNGVAVESWLDVLQALRQLEVGQPASVEAELAGGSYQTFQLTLTDADRRMLGSLRFAPDAALGLWTISRQTANPAEAAWWGVTETRDSLLQVYVTLHRLFAGSVPVKGLMGPVGMAQVGTKVAAEGWDRLLWFLAIISANLAVVNFLPIPVVDGGHFLFLTIEKIQGKPVSERTMAIAQYAGLILIGSVFILVTYQDIIRLITVH